MQHAYHNSAFRGHRIDSTEYISIRLCIFILKVLLNYRWTSEFLWDLKRKEMTHLASVTGFSKED